jgi:hypothetical protein
MELSVLYDIDGVGEQCLCSLDGKVKMLCYETWCTEEGCMAVRTGCEKKGGKRCSAGPVGDTPRAHNTRVLAPCSIEKKNII